MFTVFVLPNWYTGRPYIRKEHRVVSIYSAARRIRSVSAMVLTYIRVEGRLPLVYTREGMEGVSAWRIVLAKSFR